MKIRQIIAVALLFAAGGAQGQLPQDINVDLPEMYKEIDEAIGNSPQYIADYRAKLRKVEGDLGQATNDEQRLMLLMQLSDMYESFNADSTLSYIGSPIPARIPVTLHSMHPPTESPARLASSMTATILSPASAETTGRTCSTSSVNS